MNNRIKFRKLGRDSEHRRALFRNLVEALVRHGRIRTTLEKAKEVQRHADKVITLAKTGTHQAHVKANSFLISKETKLKLFNELGPRYQYRNGGYTRIIRAGYRRGDRAEMAIIEYVDREGELRPAKEVNPPAVEEHVEPDLLEKLSLAVRTQEAVKEVVSKGLPRNLVPSFPTPSVIPTTWEDVSNRLPKKYASFARSAATGSESSSTPDTGNSDVEMK